MTARTERLAFCAAVAILWLFFFIQALHTPVLLDDWYQLTWHRHHDLSPASVWEYAHYNYFNFNPRIGDVLLLLVNGPAWIHLVLTPLVQLAVLPLAFAIAFGRWPKPTMRDLQLLLVLQTLIWVVIPIPGIVYFYRPFTTNYLWSFALMLALFVPYRLELARDSGARRGWLAPLMLPLGWLAGMGNEHTGPTAMLVMAVVLYAAWRRRRLRIWMFAGAAGLFVGYPMLFFAPGQALRYAGMATQQTPLHLIKTRGLDGNWEIILDFLGEAQLAIDLLILATLVALQRARSRGEMLAGLSRAHLATIAVLIVAAGSMVATQFASPTVGERLFFAPAVLFVAALLVLADWVFVERAARRVLLALCLLMFLYNATRMALVLRSGYLQNQQRLAQLAAAPRDTVVQVPPYSLWRRSRWWWGDDFSFASLREYVANEVYDLKGIEIDRYQFWAQPTPVERYDAKRVFEPPLSPEQDAKLEPRYIPTFWEWALVQLRRSIKLGAIGDLRGHRLVRYTVDVASSELRDPKARPQRVFDWTPTSLDFVDGRPFDDPAGDPYVRVWGPSMPERTTDVFVVGCGRTERVEPRPDIYDDVGPLIPIDLSCRGTYTAFVCDPDICWLAGRYWR